MMAYQAGHFHIVEYFLEIEQDMDPDRMLPQQIVS